MPKRRKPDRPDCDHRGCGCADVPSTARRRRPQAADRVPGDDWAPWIAAVAANA